MNRRLPRPFGRLIPASGPVRWFASCCLPAQVAFRKLPLPAVNGFARAPVVRLVLVLAAENYPEIVKERVAVTVVEWGFSALIRFPGKPSPVLADLR